MEAATPLRTPHVRTVGGDRVAVDGLVIEDDTTVRLVREREDAGDDTVALLIDALEIGTRVLDREQTGANAEYVKTEFERAARLRPYELYIGRRTPSRLGYGRSHHKQTMVLSPKSRRSTAVTRAQLDNGGPCELRHAPCCYQPSCSRYSLMALAAMANARFATGTPAYSPTWSSTS